MNKDISKDMTIEELNKKLRELLSSLEDKSLPLNTALEIYKESAITLDLCYKALDKAQGEISDINEQIEKIRQTRGEL